MATGENPNPSVSKDIIIRDIFTLWLPKDIIYDILCRLTVKTLSLLKSVSKSWLSLISDPDFIKTHLLKSTNDAHLTGYHLLVSSNRFMPNGEHYSGDKIDVESLSLYSLLNEPDTKTVAYAQYRLSDHNCLTDRITRVVGCCNGLVCLASESRALFLWNPSTRESRRLPILKPKSHYVLAYGFCYDESDDDYKVFSIFGSIYSNTINKVFVYSSKTDISRRIVDYPDSGNLYDIDWKGMFANEAMHWVWRPDQESKVIVSLDIKTETFKEVLPPKHGEDVCRWMLGTFEKSLSFCSFCSTHVDIWVMKKFGTEESWTKLFTMAYTERPEWLPGGLKYPNVDRCVNLDRPTHLAFLKPINMCQNGDIIMMLNSRIQLYNLKDNAYKELFNRGKEHDLCVYGFNCDVDTYVESLISPIFKPLP